MATAGTNIDLAEKQKELLPALLIGKPAKSFISTFFDFILFGHQDLETISEDASSPGKIFLYNIKRNYLVLFISPTITLNCSI